MNKKIITTLLIIFLTVFFLFLTGRFLKVSSYKMTCPKGFRLDKKTCFRIEEIPFKKTCLKGELIDGGCYKEEEMIYFCDDGYMKKEDKCLKTINKNEVCPSGYKDAGKWCLLEEEALKDCPLNSSKKDGKCFRKIEDISVIDKTCPEGFHQELEKCVKQTKIKAVRKYEKS